MQRLIFGNILPAQAPIATLAIDATNATRRPGATRSTGRILRVESTVRDGAIVRDDLALRAAPEVRKSPIAAPYRGDSQELACDEPMKCFDARSGATVVVRRDWMLRQAVRWGG
ncbi:MAG: hypothetical protein WD875_17350, partial [Pirellulales bacterium]